MFRTISKVIFPGLVLASLSLGAPAFAGQARHAQPHHGGLIGAALHDVELRPDQRKSVDEIAAEARSARTPVRDAGAALRAALAEQVKNNAVAAGPLSAKIAALADASSRTRAAEDSEIDKLHAVLDPSQRATVADKVEGTKAKGERNELGRLSKRLGLSAEQRQQIATLLKDDRAARAEQVVESKAKERTALEAFKGDGFQMETIRPAAEARAETVRAENERIGLLKKITGLLTPDQRAKLAASVAKGARI